MMQATDPLSRFAERLSLPLIAAPMFLVSGVELENFAFGILVADGYLAVTLEKLGRSAESRPHWKQYRDLAPEGDFVELAKEFSE